MSRQESSENGSRRVGRARAHPIGLGIAVTIAMTAGLAACGGDDDDAAESTTAENAAADTTLPAEITGASETSTADAADVTEGATDTTPARSEPETAGTAPPATDDGSTDTTDAAAGDALAAESATSDPDGGTTTEAGPSDQIAARGPTTTGPQCQFEENSSLPLERCDMGPAVAVVQSLLQAEGYDIGTVDGEFGDQTLNAVREFQQDEGLEVDGLVGLQTWTALDVSQFGSDEDGDGVIEPNEIDLSE